MNFPVKVRIPVAWGEMDAFRHVNNIVFFKYFESARIKYFEEIGFQKYIEKTGIGPILAETSCKFLKPIIYPDNINTHARVKSFGSSSFVMEYNIVSDKMGLVAEGEGVIVIYDYKNSRKVEMPKEIKDAIEKLEKEK